MKEEISGLKTVKSSPKHRVGNRKRMVDCTRGEARLQCEAVVHDEAESGFTSVLQHSLFSSA